jgi:hypothetical protein
MLVDLIRLEREYYAQKPGGGGGGGAENGGSVNWAFIPPMLNNPVPLSDDGKNHNVSVESG